MLSDAKLILAKDLRVEWRAKVGLGQMLPFAVLVLVLFGFALDPDRGILDRATAGLYWVAVLFAGVLAIQRAFAIEAGAGLRDALRMSGLHPGGIFLGKAAAIMVQLAVIEAVLAVGAIVLYGTDLPDGISHLWLFLATTVATTAAIGAAGTLYGVLASGLRVRDTLVPFLLLPALAPVLLGATRATDAALERSVDNGWGWCGLLSFFAVLYAGFGIATFGTLLEES